MLQMLTNMEVFSAQYDAISDGVVHLDREVAKGGGHAWGAWGACIISIEVARHAAELWTCVVHAHMERHIHRLGARPSSSGCVHLLLQPLRSIVFCCGCITSSTQSTTTARTSTCALRTRTGS